MVVIIMGVTGCGKTTVGGLLAERMGWEFCDADKFHPPENIAKMSAGIPLDDNDRIPWLRRLAGIISESGKAGRNLVMGCSALKRSYRGILSPGGSDVRFVFLKGSRETLQKRLSDRKNHFMPSSLLESQLATLEEPSPGEAYVVEIENGVEENVGSIVQFLERGMAG